MRAIPLPDREAERGNTVTEVLLALAISAALSLTLTGALLGAARYEKAQAGQANSEREIHASIDKLLEDLRVGLLAPALHTKDPNPHSIVLVVPAPGIQDRVVEWTLTQRGLERRSYSTRTREAPVTVLFASDAFLTEGAPTFTLYDSSSRPVDPSWERGRLQACTVRVEINLYFETSSAVREVTTAASITPSGDPC